MKTLFLIGIGPGDPDALTLAAVAAIRRVDVFLFLDKDGDGRDSLIRFRQDILDRHRGDRPYRILRAPSPRRDRDSPDYPGAVEHWRQQRTAALAGLIDDGMRDGEQGGILIWGDPMLYDGTIASMRDLIDGGRDDLAFEVIPGITSVQMLMARHRLPLNRIAETITITTGRQIESADPADIDNTVVMLDARSAFRRLADQPDLDIYWGGDLGGNNEVLISGPLTEVADRIDEAIAEQRRRKGWIMDCYLLRRRRPGTLPPSHD